ncbi:Lovastatin diketide synthase LovF [Cytospora mali]|uniref:Lovastatin diketide synthase LovF n=1 Tax=Cytospora mali TaxID=578113 RepID=A0A194VRT3_CYTMA|nr:Lovastatin diketide synthase LovF [Valsa mali]
MGLIVAGHLKPIGPVTTFSFTDIPGAFRHMRGGTHVGKIVITDGPAGQPKVQARPAPRTLALRDNVSYLIVGGLKGLCGTMAINMARRGATHLVILSRSGCSDKRSQAALQNIRANGCSVMDIKGDASKEADVRRCFDEAPLPVGGVIQGAMVLRDRIFTAMSIEDYHLSTEAKFKGTWHLHNISEEKGLKLDFFAMFSSISGVVGQRGQANYAAANVFLDNFAHYRRRLGLAACSVDLGAIEDIGYLVDHQDTLKQFDNIWARINEQLFTKIFARTLLQDLNVPPGDITAAQLITNIAAPQPEGSRLLADARFSALDFGRSSESAGGSKGGDDASKAVQALFLLLNSGAPQSSIMKATLDLANRQMVQTLRLGEPMEPSKSLASYGMDSLAAVEFRNWARLDLKAELTTLEIANATSLRALSEKIVARIPRSSS